MEAVTKKAYKMCWEFVTFNTIPFRGILKCSTTIHHCLTVHFFFFSILLMAEGRVAYMGSTADAIPYFSGYVNEWIWYPIEWEGRCCENSSREGWQLKVTPITRKSQSWSPWQLSWYCSPTSIFQHNTDKPICGMGTCQNGGCEGEEENKSTESSKETEKKHIKKKTQKTQKPSTSGWWLNCYSCMQFNLM